MTLPLALLLVAGAAGSPAAAQPAEVYAVSPAADAAVIAGASLAYAVPELLGSRLVSERCPCPRSEVPGFDRTALGNRSGAAATVSDVTLALALAVPPALDALALGNVPALRQDLVVHGETLAVAGALVQVAKYAAQRPRPRTYAGDPASLRATDGYLSFWSGHATLTAAALASTAMTARYRHGERGWPWLVAAVATASVSAERVLAGKHFPSDVTAGALVGLGVGVAVPLLHRRDATLALVPNGAGLAVSLRQ